MSSLCPWSSFVKPFVTVSFSDFASLCISDFASIRIEPSFVRDLTVLGVADESVSLITRGVAMDFTGVESVVKRLIF